MAMFVLRQVSGRKTSAARPERAARPPIRVGARAVEILLCRVLAASLTHVLFARLQRAGICPCFARGNGVFHAGHSACSTRGWLAPERRFARADAEEQTD